MCPQTTKHLLPSPSILSISAWKSGLKTGKRPEKDQIKTGLLKDCSSVFSNFEIKDPKKTGIMNRSSVSLNYLFKSSPIPCKMTQNLLRYSKFWQAGFKPDCGLKIPYLCQFWTDLCILSLNLKLTSILIILLFKKYKYMTQKLVLDWFKLVKTKTGLKWSSLVFWGSRIFIDWSWSQSFQK